MFFDSAYYFDCYAAEVVLYADRLNEWVEEYLFMRHTCGGQVFYEFFCNGESVIGGFRNTREPDGGGDRNGGFYNIVLDEPGAAGEVRIRNLYRGITTL